MKYLCLGGRGSREYREYRGGGALWAQLYIGLRLPTGMTYFVVNIESLSNILPGTVSTPLSRFAGVSSQGDTEWESAGYGLASSVINH